ncbi:MAG: hypothetical protein F4X35_00655 [Alphaproteobacteria bacterium]|nr:hypothetical protein [Alphaproteobacteria bacterium]
MTAILRALAFSALLVLVILGGMRLGRSADGLSPPPALAFLPASLAALRDAGAELVPLGRAGVLDGWLLRKADGSLLTVYAAPGGHVVAGLLYGPDGLELTGSQLEKATRLPGAKSPAQAARLPGAASPAQAASDSALADAVRAASGQAEEPRHSTPDGGLVSASDRAALFARSLDVAAFTVGNAGPDLVAFVDPGCPWSRRAAAELGRLALEGAFRLHAVPVGVMSPESRAQAAGILASPRPGLAWYRSAPSSATAEDVLRLEANNALWRAFGADAVPWLAWRDRDGAIRTHAGMPASADFMDGRGSAGTGSLLMDPGREGLR